MVSFDQESALTDPIAAYVRRKSFRLQTRELQFYEYRIDLFAFSRLLGLTIAVEMKLLRWRRAVEQALLYQLCADKVFIAHASGEHSQSGHGRVGSARYWTAGG